MATPYKISKLVLLIAVIILMCVSGYLILSKRYSEPQYQSQVEATSTEYTNTEYRFSFTLPLSWKGYTVVNDMWKAYSLTDLQSVTTGPLLSIRNPLWTEAVPRQDIPVMVFTLAEWDMIAADKIHIGAAPINPSELGRNAKYVFALPARYNFAYPVGYEEVDTIIQSKPLRGF